jgi:predicted transposase/invertase (TIGR01784 family)
MGLLPMDADILPPSDDRVFKLILTSPTAKPVLADLISAIIMRPVVDVAVRSNEIPVEDTQEKSERFDVNCITDDDTQIDLEMQASRIQEDADGEHKNLKGKGVYYLCDLHSMQRSKGETRYDRLAQTYQVTFCSYTVFPGREDFANSYSLRHDKDGELLSDAIKVVYVELSKLEQIEKKAVEEMTGLEKWAVFLRYASMPNYREKLNKVIETKEALQMAGELLMSVSQDEHERARLRSRRMFLTDLASDMATSRDIGIAQGLKEGMEKGRKEGRAEGREEIARNAIMKGFSIDVIHDITGLDMDTIKKLGASAQVTGNK